MNDRPTVTITAKTLGAVVFVAGGVAVKAAVVAMFGFWAGVLLLGFMAMLVGLGIAIDD